jgi:hypothetical protein
MSTDNEQYQPTLSMEQQLKLEQVRRELEACNDVAKLRELFLGCMRMQMLKQNVFAEMMKQDFTR